ncbi:MAG: NAD(P)-binding domain-containing protein [Deltaproteobacteria bacterium]|nr:NAD(P)-binding domain-containing protein [Deltaproteobacteria bacterium]
MTPIAFLGTGLLGSGFVHGLLARGTPVVCWNRTAARTEPLAAAGAVVAATPAEAVRGAHRVHLCLSSDDAVDAVLAACKDAIDPTAIVVDHSTTSAAGAARRIATIPGYLHAPVFMSPASARAATGMMLCSGPEARFAVVERGLGQMTGDLWYIGEDPARAAGLKLLGNAMLIAIAAGLADVLTVGAGLGIAATDAHALLARLKPGGAIDVRGKRMASGDFAATFELAMARKDLGLMLDAVGDRPLAALAAIAARADALIARGHGGDDLGVLALDALPPKA